MGISRLLGICFALLFASSVTAATTIDLGPSDYRNWGSGSYQHRPGGIGSSFGQGVRLPPTLGTLNVTRNPVIPYGSVVNGMKNFVRITPGGAAASAAVTAAFVAMDWYFDQDLGEWVKDEEAIVDDPDFALWQAGSNNPAACRGTFSDPLAFCQAKIKCTYSASTETAVQINSPTSMNCLVNLPPTQPDPVIGSISATRIAECPGGSVYDPSRGVCLGAATGLPLTASDWAALEGEIVTMPPAIVGGSANDIMRREGQLPGYHDTSITGPSSVSGPESTSTSTDPVTGDTIVTNTSSQTNISYGDTTITTSTTTTSTTYQNGQETSTTVTTETPGELPVESGGGASGDWPGFCDWATVLCDWLAWTQEDPPPEQDLPAVIDDDFFEEKRISFGAKSCPPDHQIDLAPFLDTTVGVSFQPLCDFAGLIYYMVMAASYIIAAYISIGVARNA